MVSDEDKKKAKEYFKKGKTYMEFGENDNDYLPTNKVVSSMKCFEKAAKLNPQYDEAWQYYSYQAESLYDREKNSEYFLKALSSARKAVETNSSNYSALTHLGLLLKNLKSAINETNPFYKHLKEIAIELFPDTKTLNEEILDCYNQKLKIKKDKTTLSLKGFILEDLGRLENALEVYQELLSYESERRSTTLRICLVHKDLGNYEKALEYFEEYENLKKVGIDAEYPISYKAEILEALGKTDDANDVYRNLTAAIDKALMIKPEKDSFYLLRTKAITLEKLNRYTESLAIYEGLIEKFENKLKGKWFQKAFEQISTKIDQLKSIN